MNDVAFKPFPRLTPAQLAAVKRRGWHGYRARTNNEWHLRFEISHEFYRIEDAKEAQGLPFRIDAQSSYREAARIVEDRYTDWVHTHLPEGYATIEVFG